MDAKTYWETKLLTWEKVRYSSWSSAYPLSWTVRARFFTAARVIRERLPKGGSIFELGCGSGLLAERLVDHCGSYKGIDIAANAIELARQRVPDPRFVFESGDLLKMDFPKADLTVLLGVTDWLDEDGVRKMFAKIRSRHMLISHTQAASWNPYTAYRLMMDRPVSPDSYRARNYSAEQIRAMLDDVGYRFEAVTRPSVLNPGALVWATQISN